MLVAQYIIEPYWLTLLELRYNLNILEILSYEIVGIILIVISTIIMNSINSPFSLLHT